jgi:hypothetical protein
MSFGIPSVVIPPPPPPQAVQIVSQPQSRTNAVGTTATFSVVANGAAPISYQWRKNGVNIPSASNPSAITATLSLPSVPLSDNGSNYSVVVSNLFGSVTSSAATLTVTNTGGGTPPPGTLFYTRMNNNAVQLFWSNPVGFTFTLQQAFVLSTPGGASPWANVTTVSPYTNAVTTTNVYYRLIWP